MKRARSTTSMIGVCTGAFLAFTALTGCGADSSSGGGGKADKALMSQASENVKQNFANSNAAFTLDPVSDPDALKGKKLMYLSAIISSPAGSAALKSLEEVKDVLGFDLITFDGQGTPSKYQEGMRQAVAQKVDAIMIYGIDCAGNEAALKEIRTAGIKIIGLQSIDCNEADPAAESYFDSQPLYPIGDEAGKIKDVWAADGEAQADYLISKLDGNVKVIQFDASAFGVTAALGEGFRKRMADCDTCEIVQTVTVGLEDFGPNLQAKAEQALLKHPDANAVQIAYDDLVTLGVSSAIQGSGRKNDILTVAGTGNNATMTMIRKDDGLLSAGWVEDYDWDHYAGIDTALRVLSDDPAAESGHPIIFYDKDNNVPKKGAWVSPVDFRAEFKKAWGIQ